MTHLRSLLLGIALTACSPAPRDDGRAPAADTAAADSAATDSTAVVGCSADFRPGLVLHVVDARSGALVGGFTAVARLDSAGRTFTTDSAVMPRENPSQWGAAGERAGTYALRVTHPDYLPWDSAGVVVTRDVCHVRTVRLEVRLRPRA